MPRAIGANCRLLMLPETIYGTAPGSNWRRMPFLSCDLGAEQPLLDADCRSSNALRRWRRFPDGGSVPSGCEVGGTAAGHRCREGRRMCGRPRGP